MPKLGLISLALLLLSCSDPFGTSGLQGDLDRSRALWETDGGPDYTFRFQRLCFCGFIDPVAVVVESGRIVSVTNAETGEPIDSARYDQYLTVDGIFDFIQDAIDRDAHELVVMYDADLGYPLDVNVDFFVNAADDEQHLIASGVQLTP